MLTDQEKKEIREIAEKSWLSKDKQKILIEGMEAGILIERERLISFGMWYSGMDKEKVEKAYKRFTAENNL